VVILRQIKYIKTKITIAALVVGGQLEISIVGVTKRMSIKILDPSAPQN
jgi:intracellular septation protein A